MPKYPLWDSATNSSRSRFLSRLQAFVDVANEHDRLHPGHPILPNLKRMAEDMLIKVKERWPTDTKPLDVYPAFKQDSLQLSVAREINERFRAGIPHAAPSETGKIILLCGTSTAGKTSICHAAQSEAIKTGHAWIIDGADVAAEKAWTEPSEAGGGRYLSAQDHFVNAMKKHTDPLVVDQAVSVFGARTLAVALFSRQNLGNPKVDKVDLNPKADIKVQAITIHASLSQENQQQYTPAAIENLLTIIRDCPDKDEFIRQHPYPPLQQLNE